MRSTFGSIEIGKRSIITHQVALDTTNHNVANANTPGYSRQVVNVGTTYPYTYPGMSRSGIPGQIGTGVQVESIKRIRDQFLDMQYTKENRSLGEWEIKSQQLVKIEKVFNEPDEKALQKVLDEFWKSLQTLSKNPEDAFARQEVLQRGKDLVENLNFSFDQLWDQQQAINGVIENKVKQINNLADQIAQLNVEIARVESVGDNANDLRDRREKLVDELSKMVNVSISEDANGMITVMAGNGSLVVGKYAMKLATTQSVGPHGQPITDIIWATTGLAANFNSGEIKGLLDSRDIEVSHYMDELNTIAWALVNRFNDVHYNGVTLSGATNVYFFNPPVNNPPAAPPPPAPPVGYNQNWAKAISVAITNPDDIAASVSGLPGDGDNAIAMANTLRMNTHTELGGKTFQGYYEMMIAKVSTDSQAAQRLAENQGDLVAQIDQQRMAVSDVNLDEEMTNMIKFQKGYDAAARFITAIDEMLDTIINRMGVVGR